jgi:ribosomal protein S18 acetylase RimI-like enzyme
MAEDNAVAQEPPAIGRLTPQHAGEYRALMLEAYRLHPDAFTSTVAEREGLPLAWWQDRLNEAPDAAQVVLGAWHEGRLRGVAGISFATRTRERHKAALFGMVVTDAYRRRGMGNQLVAAALACARARHGVRLVQLTATQGNAAALALYQRHGFVAFGVEPEAVAVGGTFLGKVHLWCRLDAGPTSGRGGECAVFSAEATADHGRSPSD